MRAFVLDASLALEWFTDGASEDALFKRSLFDDRVAIVPHLWRFEVMNVITTWLRRGAVSDAESVRVLNDVMQLPFAVVDEGSAEAIVSLAHDQRLSAYDASYLHVAMITGEPLATLDTELMRAAQQIGVECI